MTLSDHPVSVLVINRANNLQECIDPSAVNLGSPTALTFVKFDMVKNAPRNTPTTRVTTRISSSSSKVLARDGAYGYSLTE